MNVISFLHLAFFQYAFEADNPYQDSSDPYNEGLQKKLEGDLPSAILLFEAALQKDPDHVKAWETLGKKSLYLGTVSVTLLPFFSV